MAPGNAASTARAAGNARDTAVWVFDAATSTVRAQPVQVATADGNQAVIASGLAPGMQVVATGVHVLSPGQKVTIYQEKYAPAQSQQVQAATEAIATQALSAASAAARQ